MKTRRHQVVAEPLAHTFSRVADLGIEGLDFSVRVGVPGDEGWVPATQLADDGELLEANLGRIGRGYGTGDRAITGSFFLKGYVWRLVGAAVVAFLLDRRLPDLRAENVALRFGDGGYLEGLAFLDGRFAALPGDLAAAHPGALVLPSEDALLAWMRDRLAREHLPGLFSALRSSRPRRGLLALWGGAADMCAEAFLYAGEALGRREEACAYAERLLDGTPPLDGKPNYFALRYDGGTKWTRVCNTCCLYYRLGKEACFTCPRITDEERLRRLLEDV